MDLSALEQWQLLCFLLFQQSQGELDEPKCLGLHHLLLSCIGEHYQQIACRVPAAPIEPLHVHLEPGRIKLCNDTGEALHLMEIGTPAEIPADVILHCPICSVDSKPEEFLRENLIRLIDDVSALPAIIPQPLAAPQKEGSFQRKWRKFRRDPVLFIRDSFQKKQRK